MPTLDVRQLALLDLTYICVAEVCCAPLVLATDCEPQPAATTLSVPLSEVAGWLNMQGWSEAQSCCAADTVGEVSVILTRRSGSVNGNG